MATNAEKAAMLRDVTFAVFWERSAALGQCDALGGAEYRRVWSEWVREGRPHGIQAFIRDRANVGSIDPEPPHNGSDGKRER